MEDKMMRRLAEYALEARKNAYCPYSKFSVGAALLGGSGKIYTGCNVENAAYGPSNCAERTAVFKAVSEGELRFLGIAIAGGASEKAPTELCPPCGVCRQVLREFSAKGFEVLLVRDVENVKLLTLDELLPMAFGPENL